MKLAEFIGECVEGDENDYISRAIEKKIAEKFGDQRISRFLDFCEKHELEYLGDLIDNDTISNFSQYVYQKYPELDSDSDDYVETDLINHKRDYIILSEAMTLAEEAGYDIENLNEKIAELIVGSF